jgi:hypothetical protein
MSDLGEIFFKMQVISAAFMMAPEEHNALGKFLERFLKTLPL